MYGGGVWHPNTQFPLTLKPAELIALHKLLNEHVEWPEKASPNDPRQ